MSSQVFTTTGSQTWTWPAGVTSVTAECLGAGGGSGIASGNPATGGGGKGGSYAKATITKGAETLLTVLVGAPGAVAAAGGFSSIDQGGTTVCLAPGGGGGATQATNSANGAGATTSNGTAVGTTIFAGGNGGTGDFTSGVAGSGAGGGAAGPTGAGGNASINVAGIAGTGLFLDGQKYQGAGAAGVGNSTVGSAAPSGLNNNGGGASGGKANNNTDQGGWSGRQGIVVLTWTDAPTTLQLLTSTGKLRQANLTTALALPMSPAPAVGSGIVLTVCGTWSFPTPTSPMVFGANWVTDNRGNTYKLAVTKQLTGAPNFACAIYYCEKVGTTGSPFTITITPDDGAKHYFVASAREIGGLGTNILKAIQTASNTGTTATTAASGSTPTVNGEALAVAVMGRGLVGVATAITVETIYPNWTQEFEELDGSGYIASEGDLRITTYSGAVSANWTHTATSPWVAAIAAFQSLAPPAPQSVSGVSIASTLIVPGTEQKLLGVNDPTDYSNYWGSNYNAGYMCGQSISGHTGPLTAVAIQLLQLTPDTPAVNLYFTINQGALNGPVLATSSNVLLSSLSTSVPGFVKFNFPSPITMVAGTTYVLQLNRDLYSNATVRVYIGAGTADTYPGGVFYSPVNDPDGFGRDASFRLYTLTCHTVSTTVPPQTVAGNTIPSASVVRVATVAAGPVTLSGATIAAGNQRFAPTVVPGAVTISGATYASTPQTYPPTVDVSQTSQTITGATISTGAVASVPVVATGPVTVLGVTVTSGAVLRAATVTVGPVAVSGATIPSGSAVRAATVSTGPVTVVGSGISSTGLVFAPVVTTGPVTVSGATRLSGAQVFQPVVSTGPVTVVGATLASGTVVSAAVVTTGAVTVIGATRPATSFLFAPSVAAGPVTLLGVQIPSTSTLAPPALTSVPVGAIGAAFLTSTAAVFTPSLVGGLVTILVPAISAGATTKSPSVSAGPVTVVGSTLASGAVVHPASLSTGPVTLLGSTCVTTVILRSPVVTTGAVTVGGATVASMATLDAPSVIAAGAIVGATLTTTSQVFVPTVTLALVNQSVLTGTLVSASFVRAPTVTPPPLLVSTATIATDVAVRVPTVAFAVGLFRVRSTGKVKAAGPVSSITLTLSPAPAVGNAVVVLMAGQRDSTGMTFGGCTDNHGHTYGQGFERRIGNHGEYAITVYYLPRVLTSSAPFTITITGLGTDHCFEGCAIEVGGLAGGELSLASYMTNTVTSSPTVTTGNTTSLTGEHFVAIMCARYLSGTSITAQAVTPPWLEEYEELNGTWLAAIAGEGDSRILTLSGVASGRWTLDSAAPYVAGVAAFKVVIVSAAVSAATLVSGSKVFAAVVTTAQPQPVVGATIQPQVQVFAAAVAPGAVTVGLPPWSVQALVTEPAVAHEPEPAVGFATITNTVQVFAPTNLNMGATDVFVGSVARTAVTYPPSVIRALHGAAITNTSSLHTPRVSLVDDRQLVSVPVIVNDAGTSRVLDVFDLLTIGPWVKTVGIYAPVVWIPPIQTIDVPTILSSGDVSAPESITIVPIAAATIASGSRIFIPIIIPGGWEVAGPIPLTSTVVLIPPAVANPDRFSALTGVAITPALGALGVVNLNPITSAISTAAVGTVVAGLAGLPSGVLTATTVTTMLPAWAVVPSSAGTPTVVGLVRSGIAALARGGIVGAVLKPLTVATVVGTNGLDAISGLGVLSCPRVAAVTGVPTPTALAVLGSLLTVTASQVPAVGDVGALQAFSGVVAMTTGVSATATVAAVSPQLERVLLASAAVSALGSVSLASTIPLAPVLTISQLGTVGALVSYTRGLTGVATSGTVGTVTRALSVALTAVPLTVDVGLLVGQSRATATGTTASVSLARPLPETSRTLLPATSLGAVGTVLAHAPVIRALTGTSATGALGTLTPTVTQAVSTVLATTARGTVSAATDRAAVAVVSTSAVGSIAKIAIQAVLPAVGAVGTVGALTLSRERVVPGVRSVPTVGALGHSTDLALPSVTATTAVTDVRVAPGLTGVAATGAIGLLGPAITRAAFAVSGTSALGASPLRTDSVLTGVLATSAVGDLTVLHRLAGVTAISATGALVVTVNRTVQSVLGTTGLGTVPQTTAVALGGVAAATALGTVTAGADVTTFLLNVRASCHVGTLSTSRVLDLYLTSAVGTGMLGTAVARPLFAISGVETDSAVGTLAIARQAPGVAAAGRVGLVGHAVTVGLTGAAAQGVVGSVGAVLTWQAALLGVSTSVWPGAVVAAPSSALTWVYVIGRTGHVGLTVDGARTLTGVLADIAQADLGIVTRHAVTGSAATGRTGLLAGAGERTIALPSVEVLGRTGLVHARLQTAGSGVVTPTASADALGVEWATALLGIRTSVSPGVIGVTGADAPPEILDFTVVVKREEMLTVAVETVIDGWCVVTRKAETVVEVEPEPDFLSPVTIQRAPVLHPLTVVTVKPEYLDVTVAVTQSLTIEVMRSGVWDEVRVSRQLDLTASLDSDLDVSVRVLLEETYAVETER